jgi:hypothetical protein
MLKQQTGDRGTHLAEAEEGEVLLSGHANSWDGAFFSFDERRRKKGTGCR